MYEYAWTSMHERTTCSWLVQTMGGNYTQKRDENWGGLKAEAILSFLCKCCNEALSHGAIKSNNSC